jgi:hypothetical protein
MQNSKNGTGYLQNMIIVTTIYTINSDSSALYPRLFGVWFIKVCLKMTTT